MPKEIEKKFLISSEQWRNEITESIEFKQGYFKSKEQSASVRVRIEGEQAKLNIKGATLGIVRDEYEYDIPMNEALEMLSLFCKQPYIEKIRHFVTYDQKVFEIDEFFGENQGLIVAEVELDSDDENISLPSWVGKEVSSDTRYYNNCLVDFPYSQWEKE